MTKERLMARVRATTLKIGVAKRTSDGAILDGQRERRNKAIASLASDFGIWTLINPEGKSEFLDRAEWEQRMVAWARREGHIPRGTVPASVVPPAAPPATEVPPTT